MGTFVIVLVVALMALNIYYPQQQRPIKIKQRWGGIPIIDVTFNGKHQYEMMLDTGCSTTLITSKMAKALKVKPVGKLLASIADGRQYCSVKKFSQNRSP
jgi:predicted aspartyl protease